MTRDYYILLIVLLVALASSLAVKIDLTTADLGRHIKNGEIILTGSAEARHAVLTTNYYSYTEGDTPFINHHWLSGVVFYLVFKLSGFSGLSVLYILCILAAFLLVFDLARRYAHPLALLLVSFFAIPVIASRAEVRPEAFTYVLIALFLWICTQYYERRIGAKWLWALPVLQLVWVNLHIGFVFGPFLIGVFLLTLLIERDFTRFKTVFSVLIASCVALLVNPSFFAGAIYPFKIFGQYSYRVLENQSIGFLSNLGVGNHYTFYAYGILLGLLFLSYLAALWVDWRKISLPLCIYSIVFGVMGWVAIRDFPLVAFVALPAFALNMQLVYREAHEKLSFMRNETLIILGSVALFVIGIVLSAGFVTARGGEFGLGLRSNTTQAAAFFLEHNLQGPVFNNYDIGGYLIYSLFPKERVYFDNRPETYSQDFVSNDYIRAMEDPAIFTELDEKYKFNVIMFNYRDYTPWGQTFITKRVFDPDWAAVYADSSVLILIKRTPQNADIIKRYKLPDDTFKVSATNYKNMA